MRGSTVGRILSTVVEFKEGMKCSQMMVTSSVCGGLAQMVERSLSMREVPGSIPGFSISFFFHFSHYPSV